MLDFYRPTRIPCRRSSAFTLVEVMIALAIFAVGLVAVASIFPAAILLQKETVHQVEGKYFSRNAEALVAGRGFEASESQWNQDDVENASSKAGVNYDGVRRMIPAAFNDWSLIDRSYGALRSRGNRRVFWVPLIYDADPEDDVQDWRVYLFVVRGQRTGVYPNPSNPNLAANPNDPTGDPNAPGVPRVVKDTDPSNLANGVKIGDAVLGTDGVVYDVEADGGGNPTVNYQGSVPGAIWYAASAKDDDNSTFVRIITLIDNQTSTKIIREP